MERGENGGSRAEGTYFLLLVFFRGWCILCCLHRIIRRIICENLQHKYYMYSLSRKSSTAKPPIVQQHVTCTVFPDIDAAAFINFEPR